MRNPGIILKLADGRKVIVYNKQQLMLKGKSKVIMNLIDDDHILIKDENGKPKILIKDLAQYNLENQEGINELIGYID